MTPEAMQRTSLEENGRANAGAVVEGEALNVEDRACGVHRVVPCSVRWMIMSCQSFSSVANRADHPETRTERLG